MKAPRRKSAHDLLPIGRQIRAAKQKMTPAEFAQWRKQRSELRHEAKPDRVVIDLDKRLARLSAMFEGSQRFKHKLPCTGIATLRELSKLGAFWLEKSLEVDLIGPPTTRAQVDVLRGLQTGKPVAPRHKRKAKP